MKVRVKTQRLCFDGTYVRFKVYTPEDGKVMRRAAFVCSPVGDAESWDALCGILASQGCLCLTFELPGFGHTPVRAPQDNITRASILWGVLDEVDISRGEENSKWHLISHGSGCGVTLEMTRTEPGSVLSRVFISPVSHIFNYNRRSYSLSKLRRWLYTKQYELYERHPAKFYKRIHKLYGEMPDENRLDKLSREFFRENRIDTLFELFEKGYWLHKNSLSVQNPLMLIWGKNDPFGDRPDERLMQSLPDVEVHYITSAHMSMETMPQEISEYLKGWFDFVEGRIKSPAKKK
ncbi:MAG: alpha/beta hydrolase [Clostridia bacterium]|nr:alpha/beta hydrolase [Clostridia bacterium]